MNSKKLLVSLLAFTVLAILSSVSVMGACVETANPTVTAKWFTTNYTVGGATYAKGGSSITIYTNVYGLCNTTEAYRNVTAKIYNLTNLVTTINLLNSTFLTPLTGNTTENATWSLAYTVPSYDITTAGANITINATYTNTTGDVNSNVTEAVAWRIDATAPTARNVMCGPSVATANEQGCTATVRGVNGTSYYICWNTTDGVAIDGTNGTISFGTEPTGSSLGTTTGTLQSGSSSTVAKFCYTWTPLKLGNYSFTVHGDDNVTNTVANSTAFNLIFATKDEETPLDWIKPPEVTMPVIKLPSFKLPKFELPKIGVFDSVIEGFKSIWNLLFGWL